MDKESLGILNKKCPRCAIEEETWEHVLVCTKNKNEHSEFEIFKSSIDKVMEEIVDKWESVNQSEFRDNLIKMAGEKSLIMRQESLLREKERYKNNHQTNI